MEEYENFLKNKKVIQLKNIARSYIKHIKFAYSKVKKADLIEHLLKHTMLQDGKIKVIESGIPVKVIIKGKSEDSIKKMIDETDLTNVKDKTKVEKLLRGQRGAFKGRINKFETERNELIREDEDNLRKKYTKEIEEYNKQIQETKKQLKVVNALIKDFNNKFYKEDNLKKVIDNINKQYNTENDFLFVDNELVAEGETLKDMKKYVKENYDPPKKDIKGYVVSIKDNINSKIPLSITCMQITITPKLFIKSTNEDGVQTFTYTSDELLKYGFNNNILFMLFDSIKNNKVSYRKTSVPISDVMELKDKPKEEDKVDKENDLKKVLDKVNDLIDTKMDHMFVGGELIASEKSFKDIKKYVKENYDAPKKDIKGYVIRIKIDKKEEDILSITCKQITITPKLFIKSTDEDGFQSFTYTSDELLKYGFNYNILFMLFDAIKNNEISYKKDSVSISDVMELKNKPKEEDKVLDKVNDLIDTKMDHMFVGDELIASEKSFKDIKKYVKENYDAPKKDIKGYVFSFEIDKKDKDILSVFCKQITITPKLFIKFGDDDIFQTFTYTSDELLKYGFNLTHLKKIMTAIKNNEVSYRKTSVPISDIMELKNKPKEEDKVDNLKKVIDNIKKQYNTKKDFLFVDNELVAQGNNFKEIKNYMKENYDAPKKEKKGYIVRMKINEKDESILNVSVLQVSLINKKNNLFIAFGDEDGIQLFTYTPDELLKYGFNNDILFMLFDAIKNNKVSYRKTSIPITDVIELKDKQKI